MTSRSVDDDGGTPLTPGNSGRDPNPTLKERAVKPDLIERLRLHERYAYIPAETRASIEEASKEIERLREALGDYRTGVLKAFDGLCEECRGTAQVPEELRDRIAALQPILPSGGDACATF